MPTTVSFRRELYLPRALVFDAWTGAEHLSSWYPPEGCRIADAAVDAVPGGRLTLVWTDDADRNVHEDWQFVRVERPAGFECVKGPTDAEGRLRVALSDLEDACLVEVQQDGIDEARVDAARTTWESRLDRLEQYFSVI